ncbi:MAG: hypothetical protein AB1757_07105 [Acidobacteriota bacterium]
MKKQLPDRDILISYLLDKLSEAERATLAERYFTDDDFFTELLDVENELFDKYVRGVLDETDRRAFEDYLNHLPDAQPKLAVARALLQFTDQQRALARQSLTEDAPVSASRWQLFFKSGRQAQVAISYLALAGAVLLTIGLLSLLMQIRELRSDNQRLRTALSRLEKEVAEQQDRNLQSSERLARLQQLEEQLGIEQKINEEQAQRFARLQLATSVVAAWVLTPTLRSSNPPDQVQLPRKAKFVSITLPIEGEGAIGNYRVIIQTTEGEQRRELSGLRAGKTIAFKLAADYFTATTYKVTLIGKDKTSMELARDYYFTVSKR